MERAGKRNAIESRAGARMKQRFEINDYPWGRPHDAPESYAEIEFKDECISVYMHSKEHDILRTVTKDNGPVYRDSCMEFFFSPCPDESSAYYNFEVNPLGTLYTGFSHDGTRASSAPIDHENKIFISACVDDAENEWSIEYEIPYEFIRLRAPGFDPAGQNYITGNFYKCADDKAVPHYAVWNHIDTAFVPEPDFHVQRYFGKIEIL